jgi:hypothetical protein
MENGKINKSKTWFSKNNKKDRVMQKLIKEKTKGIINKIRKKKRYVFSYTSYYFKL